MTTYLIKRQTTDRVVKIGDPIPLRHKRGKLAGAPYNVVNTSSTIATEGQLLIPPSGLTMRLNSYDSNGVDNSAFIATLVSGDIINIGAVPATLAGQPIHNTGTWALFVVALPVVADGNYIITVTKA